MPYRLAIFDFDGTLADSLGWFAAMVNGVAARYRFRPVTPEDLERLREQDNHAIIRHLGVPMWKLPLIARHMRRLVAADAHRIRPFPGTAALLRDLEDAGIVLAVVSSNSEENIRRILGPEAAARISHYGCGSGLFGKAAKFARVARKAGIAPAETLCVGDEARDIDAAHQAGMAAAAVAWGYAGPALLRSRRPALFFETMDQIAPALTGNGDRSGACPRQGR